MTGIERIAEAFESARASGRRAALMPYLMGGFPDLDTSREIGLEYARAGADLIELGVPFSDPLADGPVIHAADTAALRAGANLPRVIEVARAIAEHVPVVVMCYVNPILARRSSGVVGATKGTRASPRWSQARRTSVASSSGRSGTIRPLTRAPTSRSMKRSRPSERMGLA